MRKIIYNNNFNSDIYKLQQVFDGHVVPVLFQNEQHTLFLKNGRFDAWLVSKLYITSEVNNKPMDPYEFITMTSFTGAGVAIPFLPVPVTSEVTSFFSSSAACNLAIFRSSIFCRNSEERRSFYIPLAPLIFSGSAFKSSWV